MMRRAPIPHGACGGARGCSRRNGVLRLALALAFMAAATLLAAPTFAQDPSLKTGPLGRGTAFPKQKGGIFGPAPKIDKAAPLYLQADQLLYDTKNNRVIAQGNVEIYYNNYILTADRVIYDQNFNKLIAEGNSQLKDPNGSITRADRFEATDDFRDAFVQSLSVVARDDTRIAAERASRREGNVTEYERGKFTPCKNDAGMPPLWCIGAARIIHDQRAATITYQDAQFELFGVPVLYLPWFQHPDPSVKRRSGFLTPSFSNSSTLGFGFETPYYFALAPNYDFTFHPQYWSKQGVLWQGDFRHRLANGQYSIKMAAIDESQLDSGATTGIGNSGWRGSIETKGQFSLSSWWRFGWDVTIESDETFRRFYKLDPILQTDRVNTVWLQGMSERNFFQANLYHLGGLLLDDTPIANAVVHPVIDYNYIVGTPVAGGELSFNMHARSMTRTSTTIATDTTHAVAEASWRRKMIDPIGQVWTPFGSVRGDVYHYNDGAAPVPSDTVVRALGTAGLTYSYPFVAHTGFVSHIFEPTAQILVRQNRLSQGNLPNEDARSLVYDDTLLFDTDKSSGYDRLETGTRANVGLQYTFQTTGGFYGRIVFGQSFHLRGENIYANPGVDLNGVDNFSPISGLERDRSDYVAGLYLSPFAGFSVIAQGRFDEKDWELKRQDTYMRTSYGPFSSTLGYTMTRYDTLAGLADTQQDILASVGVRVTNNWSVEGQVRYDIDDKRRVQDILQLKYQDECFVLTASYVETFIDNPGLELKPDRTLMLRFELKHLGQFNYKTDQLSHVFGDMKQGQ